MKSLQLNLDYIKIAIIETKKNEKNTKKMWTSLWFGKASVISKLKAEHF